MDRNNFKFRNKINIKKSEILNFFKFFPFFNPTFLSTIPLYFNIWVFQIPYGFLYVNYKKFLFHFLFWIFILFFYILLSSILNGFDNGSLIHSVKILSFLSGAWIYFSDEKEIIPKVAKFFYWFFVFFGLIQFSGYLKDFFYIFEFIFPKLILETLYDYRGVQLTFTENARASFYFLIIYIIAYGLRPSQTKIFPFIILVLFILFVLTSVTGYLIFTLFILIKYNKSLIFLFSLSFILILIIILNVQIPDTNSYNFKLDKIIFAINELSIINLIETFKEISGGRAIASLSMLEDIIKNPLINFYESDDYISLRTITSSSILFYLRSFGIFGLIYLLFFFKGKGSIYNALSLTFLFTVYSPNGTWIVLYTILKEYYKDNK